VVQKIVDAWRATFDGSSFTPAVPAPIFRDDVAVMEILDRIGESAAGNGALIRL
jgi:hypothetical protein